MNGLPMGSAGRAEGPVKVGGPRRRGRPIERIDVFRGLDHRRMVSRKMVSPYGPDSFEGSNAMENSEKGIRER